MLVLATRNRKKRDELREILGGAGVELRDLSDWPAAPEVVEDGAGNPGASKSNFRSGPREEDKS